MIPLPPGQQGELEASYTAQQEMNPWLRVLSSLAGMAPTSQWTNPAMNVGFGAVSSASRLPAGYVRNYKGELPKLLEKLGGRMKSIRRENPQNFGGVRLEPGVSGWRSIPPPGADDELMKAAGQWYDRYRMLGD